MTVCNFCDKEINPIHAGRQLGNKFMHQWCYITVIEKLDNIWKTWISEAKEKIELEAGQSGSSDEIILIMS